MSAPVIAVEDLRTHIVTRWGTIKAVDGVSFAVGEGETLGLVGESGSGKSMTCLSVLRLVPRPAARIVGGRVRLDGEDLLQKTEREMQRIRGKRVAMILQDPMSSLNPVFSVGMQVREPLISYHGLAGRALRDRAVELLGSVGISSPAARLRAFPHQLSGGMRQRVVGAMAISGPPRLLIADEAERPAGVDRERDGVHRAHEPGLPSQDAAAQGEVLGERRRLEERRRAHAGASSQHRLDRPAAGVNSGGSSARQRSITRGQRGANAHPGGSAARSGGWPSMAVSQSVDSERRGTDSSSARV